MTTDLQRAFDRLIQNKIEYSKLFAYAEGRHPLVYSTQRLKEAFDRLDARFNQNWCAVVLDSALDRISLKGFDTDDARANTAIDAIFNELQIQLDAYDTHYGASVAGESFLIVWPGEDNQKEIYYNDPRMVTMFYESDNPKKKEFAAKLFKDGDVWRMTLYYTDRLEYYILNKKDLPSTANGFRPDEPPTAINKYGVIPVFHFRTRRVGVKSEIGNIITLQDAVNKLLADMMVAAEFGAFRQRYIITDSDTSSLKNAPNEIWNIPGTDSKVGEFGETNLGNYLESIDKLANSIAIISRTPKHYFYSAGGAISGEALLAMESPLTKKVQQLQINFGVTWREVAAFILQLDGIQAEASSLVPVWEPAESVQPLTEAQARKTSIESGIPLKTQLRREGWSTSEIDQMDADKKDQQKQDRALGQAVLDELRVNDEQTNPQDNNNSEDQNEHTL